MGADRGRVFGAVDVLVGAVRKEESVSWASVLEFDEIDDGRVVSAKTYPAAKKLNEVKIRFWNVPVQPP